MTERCDACDGAGRCHRYAPQWWSSVPAVVQRAVIQALFKHGGLRSCSGDKSICDFHMKLAFRQIVRDRSQKFIIVLMKEALCDHAGFTKYECREWFATSIWENPKFP